MPSTTVQIAQTVLVDVEVEHKFEVGDVIFPWRTPEDPNEVITGIHQYENTDQVMYYFQGNRWRDQYGRSAEWVDRNYMKAGRKN